MSELDYVRAACEELGEPGVDAIARAREVLRREIATGGSERPTRSRLRIAVVAVSAAAGLAICGALLVTLDHTPFGVRVAEAASEAVTPANDELVHSVSHTTVRWIDRTGTTTAEQSDNSWWMTTPPTRIDRTTYRGGGTVTYLLSDCGSISYDSTTKLFTVSPSTGHLDSVDDPVAAAANALRSGHIQFRGKLIYHGIPAAKLVVTQYGSTTTYIVRRDSGYPLETVDRRVTSYSTRTAVTTYSLFQHLPRTRKNESRLALPSHMNAFVVRTARAARTAACREFGTLESLTGRRPTR